MSMTGLRTSLEKLQALDKDYETFDEQLEALSNILHVPNEATVTHTDQQDQEPPRQPARRYHGRASYALRWLLTKLQSSPHCRASLRAWTLLTASYAALPASIAAKHLAASRFSAIVQDTLAEACSSRTAKSTSTTGSEDDHAEPSGVAAGSSSDSTRNRKRKMHGDPEHQSRKRQARDPADFGNPKMLDILHTLGACFRAVRTNTHTATSASSLPLRTDVESASRFLGSWLIGLCQVYHSTEPPPLFTKQILNTLLEPILHLWDNRVRSTDAEADAAPFAANALWPAACLLARLQASDDLAEGQQTVGYDQQKTWTRSIERLIARHIFIPARAAFHEAKRAGGASDSTRSTLELLLDPIKDDIREASLPYGVVPILFSVAVRCTPRSSPKRKLAEQSWLEHVFEMFMQCLGIDLDSKSSLGRLDTANFNQLCRMLKVAKRYEVKISRERLKALVSVHAGVAAGRGTKTRWDLIGMVVALDDQVFVTDRGQNADDNQVSVLEDLFNAITKHTKTQVPRVRESIKDKIIKPLLRAHVTARKLRGFVLAWHSCLVDGFDQPDLTIWQEQDLKVTLAEHLETSLTTKQILDLVENFACDISISELEEDSRSRCFAGAETLTAIFSGCSSDDTLTSLLPRMQAMFEKSLHLLFKGRVQATALKCSLWRLASTSFGPWVSLADREDIEGHPLFSSRTPALARCYEMIESSRDNVEAFTSMVNMYSAVTSRHIESSNIEAGVLSALRCFLTQADVSSESEHAFVYAVAANTSVLGLVRQKDPDGVSNIFSHILARSKPRTVAEAWLVLLSELRATNQYATEIEHALQNADVRRLIPELSGHQISKGNVPASDGRQDLNNVLRTTESASVQSVKDWMDMPEERRHELYSLLISRIPDDCKAGTTKACRLLYHLVASSCQPSHHHLLARHPAHLILERLSSAMITSNHWPTFHLITSTLSIVQTYHVRHVTQYGAEAILASLYAVSAPKPPQSPKSLEAQPAKIYSRLTHLAQTLLSLHRRKLAGRFHLLIPLLQALLRCLFTAPPSTEGAKMPSFVSEQPSWLSGITSTRSRSRLLTKHAASYTRLLTTLFDPTPSTVAPPKSKSRIQSTSAGLIDYTIRARRYAGQYAPYLLLTLCQLQLDGRFADEGMREAIRPGVYAMLDAMVLVESGSGDRTGKGRKSFVEVVAQDAAGVWGVTAAQRTVLRSWWEGWERGR